MLADSKRADEPRALEDGFFACVSVKVGAVRPATFWRAAGSSTRGFWQSGPAWVAHAGLVAEIDSRQWPPGGSSDGVSAGDRFGRVRDAATRVFAATWIGAGGDPGRRPRFHGGFAFGAGGGRPAGADGVRFWEEYPTARFVLPELELASDREGAVLTVTGRFAGSVAPDAALASLEERAEGVRDRLDRGESASDPGPAGLPSATSIEEPVGPKRWRAGIERILKDIAAGSVRKVVLARPLDVSLSGIPDATLILSGLRASNPSAHSFLLQFREDRFFLGAAPELLGSLRGERFRTMAVAGSIPRGADPESDEWLGRQLLSSRKNRVEHEIVVEDVLERLAPLIRPPPSTSGPELLRLPRIQHLWTELSGRVAGEAHILDLVGALHPTAAVCGHPRPEALSVLAEEEPIGRGWYAAPVGWFDERGDGDFSPALRSAVARGPLLRLYAGAGIVDGSRPRSEWDETRVKFQTMLQALGVARVP